MGRTVFVEELGHHGEVVVRVPLQRLPFTIGRGYDNDLIVDDPFVASRHLRIEERAEEEAAAPTAADAAAADRLPPLTIVDLGSANGLLDVAHKKKVARLPFAEDTLLQIGRTRLRLRSDRYAVAPERPDRGLAVPERPWFALLMLILAAGLAAVEAFVQRTSPSQFESLLTAPLSVALALAVWSAIWAGSGRLFAARTRFAAHLALAALGVSALSASDYLLGLAAFAFGWFTLDRLGAFVLLAGVGLIIWGHLTLIRPWHRRRFALACIALTAAACGVYGFLTHQSSGSITSRPFSGAISYPQLLVHRAVSIDNMLTRAAALKPAIDRAAQDADSGDSSDD